MSTPPSPDILPGLTFSHTSYRLESDLHSSNALAGDGVVATTSQVDHNPQYIWQCPICSRSTCRLNSHRQYAAQAFQRGHQTGQWTTGWIDPKLDKSPPRELSITKVDPFGDFPLDMTFELDDIYRHFYLPWTTSSVPGPQRHLFPTSRYRLAMSVAQHDKTLFVALCSLVATQLSKIRTRTIDENALRLQVLAVSLQREACVHDGPSDARILTTLCIMSNHIAGGELDKLRPHMIAIDAFLKQRGGIEKLGMGGILADNIMYGDWTRAIAHNVPSQYKMPLPAVKPPAIPWSAAGTGFSDLPISQGVLSAARDLSILAQIYDLGCKDRATPAQRSYFSYLANVVEFSQAELNFALHTSSSLDYCLILACLLFNTIILRNYASVNPVFYSLEERFWNCFDVIRAQDIKLSMDLELWLIFTGSLVSAREPSRFEGRTVDILSSMILEWDIPDFSYVTNILDTFIWCAAVQGPSFHAIWARAVRRTTETRPNLCIDPKIIGDLVKTRYDNETRLL